MPRGNLACGAIAAAMTIYGAILLAAPPANPQEEQAIRRAAADYRAALAKGDAKALEQLWTSDGQLVDEAGGTHPAAELVAEAAKAGPQPEIKAAASKIRFLTPEVAVEDGASETISAAGETASGRYQATWVKQNGRWRLAGVCEIPSKDQAPRPADLAWMLGTWTGEANGVKIEATARWNDAKTFLLRDVKATRDGEVVFHGSQRFGIDPATGQLRSWSFDDEGGYGEAIWIKDGNDWIEQTTGVLPDGRGSEATVILSYDGQNTLTRKSTAGRVGGESVPDQETKFTRQAAEAAR